MDAFPQELVDHFIDFLHNDKKTLLACSLTCRRWKSTAQYHLFYTVCLSTESQFTSLPYSVVPFHLIQHLVISFQHDFAMKVFEMPRLSPFCNVTQLNLMLFDLLDSEYFLHFRDFLECFHSVRSVFFNHCTFPSLKAVMTSIQAFPHLQDLTLLGVSWFPDRDAETEYTPAKNRIPLRKLSLITTHGLLLENFLDALMETLPELDLQFFDVSASSNQLQIANLVERFTSLRHLSLGDFTSSHVDTLDVRAHKNVESIIFPTLDTPLPSASWFPSILTTIGSRRIRSITIRLSFIRFEQPEDVMSSVRWDMIDDVLSDSKYDKLQKFRAEFIIPDMLVGREAEFQYSLEGLLPKLAPRKIIEINLL